MEKKKGEEFNIIRMAASIILYNVDMKGDSKIIKSMAKAYLVGMMEANILVNLIKVLFLEVEAM